MAKAVSWTGVPVETAAWSIKKRKRDIEIGHTYCKGNKIVSKLVQTGRSNPPTV